MGFAEESNVPDVVLAEVRVEVFCSEPRAHVSEADTKVFKLMNVVTLLSNFVHVLITS